jgi:CRISPR-associated endonuclease/helicase Cas3
LIEEFSNELGKNLQVHEICKTYRKYYDKFKRCQYRNMGMIKAADVTDEMCKARQVLCVVNNRALAQKIFNELPTDGRFHLSTSMTPKHRKRKIKQIREALSEGKTVRLVSTSLIEAGVDLDFPTVMRQQAGLDSILQAGGRCNREGLRDPKDCAVFVFDIYQGQDRKDPTKRTRMENDAILTGNIIREFKPTNLDSLEAIHEYFYRRMYAASACQMDKDGIVAMLRDGYEGCALPFETVARKFSLIDDEKTVTVYVPEDERGAVLLRRLIKGERTRNLFRELGQYGVTVYRNQLKKLLDAGLCECTDKEDTPDEEKEYLYYMTNTDIYSDDCGLPM